MASPRRGEMSPTDMGMDVEWCLTCSKRTVSSLDLLSRSQADFIIPQDDPGSSYCSVECRTKDVQPSGSTTRSPIITATVPPSLVLATSPRQRLAPQLKSPAVKPLSSPSKSKSRQSSRPRITPVSPADTPIHPPMVAARDRRAFSFPASASPVPSAAAKREARTSQAVLPPFIRKSMVVSSGTASSPTLSATRSSKDVVVAPKSKTTPPSGGVTPICLESVFSSTSESEDERESPAMESGSALHVHSVPALPVRLSAPRPPVAVVSRQSAPFVKLDQSPSLTPFARDHARKSSQSPVAALVASSASSRSREDIISWAKAINQRPLMDSSSEDDEDEERGRSRTRRPPVLKPKRKSLESRPEEEETGAAGTTPKGVSSIGSAIAGFTIGGFGMRPIVKALTSTISPSPSAQPPAAQSAPGVITTSHSAARIRAVGALGLQSVPAPIAPAEVSKVAVVTTPIHTTAPPTAAPSSTHQTDSDVPHCSGATPTLSTISFSEVLDPCLGDHQDHADIITDTTDDAMSTYSTAPRRLPSVTRGFAVPSSFHKPSNAPQQKRTTPLRPIQSTASAIWNLSTYLKSITPFSIASALLPESSTSRNRSSQPQTPPTAVPPSAPVLKVTSPMPASRMDSPNHDAPKEIVRSLPMDIVIPASNAALANQDERMREREVNEWLDRSQSRSRGRSSRRSRSGRDGRSRPRSRERSRSRTRSRVDIYPRLHPMSPSNKLEFDTMRANKSQEIYPVVPAFSPSSDEAELIEAPARGRKGRGSRTAYDADADVSGEEDGPRRGRSRRGKMLGDSLTGTSTPAMA